jgi:hypothetical protein
MRCAPKVRRYLTDKAAESWAAFFVEKFWLGSMNNLKDTLSPKLMLATRSSERHSSP